MIDWIDLCVKEIQGADKQFVESTLKQYKKHLINLATGEQAMRKEIIEKLKGNMESAELVLKHYEDAKKAIEETLFKEIDKTLTLNECWEAAILDLEGNVGERGCRWRLRKKKKHKREIWLRALIGCGECQVGVYCPDFKCKKTENEFRKWCNNDSSALKKRNWILEDNNSPYPLWRDVSSDEFPTIDWDNKFYDKIETDPHYREMVKEAIISNLLSLRKEMENFIEAYP